jgi:hypothetical protein
MYPGVGSARADEVDAVTAEIRDGAGELAGNRSLSRLTGEAVETRTVIGDDQADPNRSLGRCVQRYVAKRVRSCVVS